MITASESERDALAEALVVANTPASLLNWLQQNSTVQRLAENSENDLLDEIQRVIRENRRTEIELGWAYALLVAIGVRRRVGSEAFGSLPIDPAFLQWASPIWVKLDRSFVPTRRLVLAGEVDQPVTTMRNDEGANPIIVNQYGRSIISNSGD